ncbi:MAG: hypothetical protein VZR09_01860 [Candidatus Gastranaerophilaceae bacterium]|nr:hypothetical protein [Candidatus Gastranaerophilaceae bacterium]
MFPKPDIPYIPDTSTQTTSDLIKSAKAGLLRAFALAMTFTPSDQMSC